jgi:hypothetical protein
VQDRDAPRGAQVDRVTVLHDPARGFEQTVDLDARLLLRIEAISRGHAGKLPGRTPVTRNLAAL